MITFVDANYDYLKLKDKSNPDDCIDDDPDYIEYIAKFKHEHNDKLGYGKYVIKYDDHNNFIERLNSKPQNSKGYTESDLCYTFFHKNVLKYVLVIKLLKCENKIDNISLAYLNDNYKKTKNIIDQYKKYLDVNPNVAYNIATIYQLRSNKKYEKKMMYYYTIAISHNVHLSFYNLYVYYINSNPIVAKKYFKLGMKYGNIDCQVLSAIKNYYSSNPSKHIKCIDILLDAYNKDKTDIEVINNLAYMYARTNNIGKMLYFINKSVEYNSICAYSLISDIEQDRHHFRKSLQIQKNALNVNKSPAYKKNIIGGLLASITMYPIFAAHKY